MAIAKNINPNAYNNLVSEGYLHSNKFNFIAIVNGQTRIDTLKENIPLLNKLNRLKEMAQAAENEFYIDVGVSGARDFEEKYLITNETNQSAKQKILKIINSQESLSKVFRLLDQEAIRDKFISVINADTKIIEPTAEMKAEEIVLKGLQTGALTVNGIKHTKVKSVDSKYVKSAMKEILIDSNESFFIEERLEEYFNWIEEKLLNNKKVMPKTLKKAFDDFKPKYESGLRKGFILKDFTSKSSGIGAILEISLEAVNDGWERVGDIIDKQTGKKLGYDLIIHGKNNDYKIQLKNSFYQSNYMNIKIQDTIKFSTLLEEIAKTELGISRELNYLLTNTIYLIKYGLNQKGESSSLLINSIPNTKEFIKNVLNEIIFVFLGNSFYKELSTEVHVSQLGNLFFIYKGIYLIPISAFIQSAISLIEDKDNSTLGKIALPAVNNIEFSAGISNTKLQNNKKNIVKTLPKGYNYPNELIEQGTDAFSAVSNSITINRLQYISNITKIEDFVQNVKR